MRAHIIFDARDAPKLPGRISGSLAWRQSRGEVGEEVAPATGVALAPARAPIGVVSDGWQLLKEGPAVDSECTTTSSWRSLLVGVTREGKIMWRHCLQDPHWRPLPLHDCATRARPLCVCLHPRNSRLLALVDFEEAASQAATLCAYEGEAGAPWALRSLSSRFELPAAQEDCAAQELPSTTHLLVSGEELLLVHRGVSWRCSARVSALVSADKPCLIEWVQLTSPAPLLHCAVSKSGAVFGIESVEGGDMLCVLWDFGPATTSTPQTLALPRVLRSSSLHVQAPPDSPLQAWVGLCRLGLPSESVGACLQTVRSDKGFLLEGKALPATAGLYEARVFPRRNSFACAAASPSPMAVLPAAATSNASRAWIPLCPVLNLQHLLCVDNDLLVVSTSGALWKLTLPKGLTE
jgi:hypothetical protein